MSRTSPAGQLSRVTRQLLVPRNPPGAHHPAATGARSEAWGADLTDPALANGHRVISLVGKGNQLALIPFGPRTSRAIDAAVGDCTDGPLLARADRSRLDRHAALDAGCSLRDGQDFARHADPRQTRSHDRARGALDRNPTYIVAIYLAVATGDR